LPTADKRVTTDKLKAFLKERFPPHSESFEARVNISEARKAFEQGDDAAGREALEHGLEVPSTPRPLEDTPEWLSERIDILCELGRYDDCPQVLHRLDGSLRPGAIPYFFPLDVSLNRNRAF
jgi:hypothetical protein